MFFIVRNIITFSRIPQQIVSCIKELNQPTGIISVPPVFICSQVRNIQERYRIQQTMKSFIASVFGLLLAGSGLVAEARPQFASFPSRPVSTSSSQSSLVNQIITELTPFVQKEIQDALGSRPQIGGFGGGSGFDSFGAAGSGFGGAGSSANGAGEPFDVSLFFFRNYYVSSEIISIQIDRP